MTDLADRIERDADAIIQELTERTNRQHECIEAKDAEIERLEEELAIAQGYKDCACSYDKPDDICLGHKNLFERIKALQDTKGRNPMSRESNMVVLRTDASGKSTVWCDPEIADLVAALNNGGLATVASCSGHGHRPGIISLADGRQLLVFDSLQHAEAAQNAYPFDVNGVRHD